MYSQLFFDIINEFRAAMINHNGRKEVIKHNGFTIKMTYYFPQSSGERGEEDKVILNISHNKNGIFTLPHFEGIADHPCQYKTLKEDVDAIAVKYSLKAETQHMSSTSRPEGVNVFFEIRNALHEMNCIQIEEGEIRHGKKFTGSYNGQRFMFNVYQKKGRATHRSRRRKKI